MQDYIKIMKGINKSAIIFIMIQRVRPCFAPNRLSNAKPLKNRSIPQFEYFYVCLIQSKNQIMLKLKHN